MNTLTQTQATPGQLKLITRIISDVADSKPVQDAIAKLDKEGAERLKGDPDFAEFLRQHVVEKIAELSISNRFVNEEVESKYGYLSGYTPKGLTEQCNRLREFFPGLGYANLDLLAQIEKGEVKLPQNAEGWFAIPNVWKTEVLARFGSSYSQAVQKVLDTIKQTLNGKFYNYREGQIDEKHLRQSVRTKKFFTELSEAQGNPDILIVPAQFGIRHRGRSVRRAREVFTSSEFGLGAFAGGIMILTHPERLQHYDDLWIDFAGDEFDDPGSDARFARAPCFSFSDGKVGFDTSYVGYTAGDYDGSASGFVPQ